MANILAAQRVIAGNVGLGLLAQDQGLRRIDRLDLAGLAIDQAVQEVEHMGLGRNAGLECELDGPEHRLLVVMQHQRQDLDHLPVAAWMLEQVALQATERLGQINERSAITQGAGLALDHRQIVPPVVDRASRLVMGALDKARVLTQDLPLGHDGDPFGVNPQADRPVGEGGRHAVAIAIEVHQARRGDALGLFNKAIEGPPQCHQAPDLAGMHIGDTAWKAAMHDLAPLCDALLFEPGVQAIEVREAG